MLVTGSSTPINAIGLQTDCMVVVLATACVPYGPRLRIATPVTVPGIASDTALLPSLPHQNPHVVGPYALKCL